MFHRYRSDCPRKPVTSLLSNRKLALTRTAQVFDACLGEILVLRTAERASAWKIETCTPAAMSMPLRSEQRQYQPLAGRLTGPCCEVDRGVTEPAKIPLNKPFQLSSDEHLAARKKPSLD